MNFLYQLHIQPIIGMVFVLIFCSSPVTAQYATDQNLPPSEHTSVQKPIDSVIQAPIQQSGFSEQLDFDFSSIIRNDPVDELYTRRPWDNPAFNFIPNSVPISVGDLDGDGIPDMMIIRSVQNPDNDDPNDTRIQTHIYFGGTRPDDAYDLMIPNRLFAIGDITGDGQANLFTADYSITTVYTITRDGYSTTPFTSQVGIGSYQSLFRDLTGDGKHDAVWVDVNRGLLHLLTSNDNHLNSQNFSVNNLLTNKIGGYFQLQRFEGPIRINNETLLLFTVRNTTSTPIYPIGQYLVIIAFDENLDPELRGLKHLSSLTNSVNSAFIVETGDAESQGIILGGSLPDLTYHTYFKPGNIDENFIYSDTLRSLSNKSIVRVGDLTNDGIDNLLIRDFIDGINVYYLGYIQENETDVELIVGSAISENSTIGSFNRYIEFGDQSGNGFNDFYLSIMTETASGSILLEGGASLEDIRLTSYMVNYDEYRSFDQIVAVHDVTGNGFDDFITVENLRSNNTELAFHEGGSNWKSPISTYRLPRYAQFNEAVSGHFRSTTQRDLIVLIRINDGGAYLPKSFYFSGESLFDEDPLFVIEPNDFNPDFPRGSSEGAIANPGDTNGNGFDDFILGYGSYNTANRVGIYYGGSSFSGGAPDMYFPNMIGSVIQGGFDLNNDGIGDFIIANWNELDANLFANFGIRQGQIHIFLGRDEDGPLNEPTYTLYADSASSRAHGTTFSLMGVNEIAIGDFTGDGIVDFATTPVNHRTSAMVGVPALHIYHGSELVAGSVNQPQQLLPIWTALMQPSNTDNPFTNFSGRLYISAVPDINGDGTDEILIVGTNALSQGVIHLGSATMADVPDILLKTPLLHSTMGHSGTATIFRQFRTPIGDFTGDGVMNFMGRQVGDARFRDQPVYLFDLNMTGTSVAERSDLPSQLVLQQNFPNPFNPTTTIRYSLPQNSDVRLEVFNVLGQRVAILADQQQTAGWHTVSFDGSRLASGVYLYRLSAGGQVTSKSLTLIK